MQMPDMSGISTGVSAPTKQVIDEPFGFQGGFPLTQNINLTASDRVRKIGMA
jgi:hypothetical protein